LSVVKTREASPPSISKRRAQRLDVVAVETHAGAAERPQPVHDLLGRGFQCRLAEDQDQTALLLQG
jgi:hypothetical protein